MVIGTPTDPYLESANSESSTASLLNNFTHRTANFPPLQQQDLTQTHKPQTIPQSQTNTNVQTSNTAPYNMEHPNPQHLSIPHKSHSTSPFRKSYPDSLILDDSRFWSRTHNDFGWEQPNLQHKHTILITRGILLANQHLTLTGQQHHFFSTFVGSNGRGVMTTFIPLPHFLRFSATQRSAVQGQKVPHEHGLAGIVTTRRQYIYYNQVFVTENNSLLHYIMFFAFW